MRILRVLPAALALSCASTSIDGALLIRVELGSDLTANCVQVVVRTPDGAETRSDPMVTRRTRPIKVGIAKGELPDEIRVYAVGFSDAKCLTPTAPLERSEDGVASFKPSEVSTVTLTLTRRPAARDDDGDSYASVDSGGDDCDDTDASVHPGALEACSDGKDNDCDSATDCAEASCGAKGCAPFAGAICLQLRCTEFLCGDEADNDADGQADCADSDCLGQSCRNGGSCEAGGCQGASSEQDLCRDNLDNDGDQKIDCVDPDCAGALCNPGDPCVTGARCDQNLACANGAPVTCTNPGASCLGATGACNPIDGGCIYPPETGKPCDDSNACTLGDRCSDAGTCAGSPLACVAPSACLRAAGCAADAGCTFVPAVGEACDDGNACTVVDRCLLDAGCGGSAVSCAPNECQIFKAQCSGDGGCLFEGRDAGAGCDGGVCNGEGGCIPFFPYPPSNFTESMLPVPGGRTTLNCDLVIDSRMADGGVGFGGWCGNPAPPFRLVPQPGGARAVLVSLGELEIGLDASVRLEGPRPVIFATRGNLQVSGSLLSSSGFVGCADGGAGGAVSGLNGGGGGGFGSAGGLGGNTGGAAGIVNGDPRLIPLRGGCPGTGGARGGGALQLSAAGNLTITGTIAARGRGGIGGMASNNAGNGAGSGGGLLLEALFVVIGPTGAVTANGGAGGEGADLAFDGQSGSAGDPRSATAASGGNTVNAGGRGGDGATGTLPATSGADGMLGASGGGGGAGVGRVRINAVNGCSIGGLSVRSPKPTSNYDAGCE